MGLQLHKAGVHVGVVMFDLEAILLISRALGKFEFAMKEAVELNRTLAETGSQELGIDVDALRERAFGQMGQRGMPLGCANVPKRIVKRGGTNIQQLHTIADPWEPRGSQKATPATMNEVLDSPALLVLAPDSMEFATAREINEKFCTQMEVVHGKGSHYNMMQGEQATVQARCVHDFWHRPAPCERRVNWGSFNRIS
ncbi:Rad54b [Symbiodinium sp. KB8]|nr:Rad54b [Symbiodinium sp. KB8]